MSDMYELMIALDLQDEISEKELAEVSWHLGLGPQPACLSIVTEFPRAVMDDSGIPVVEDDPHPLLAGRGAAWRVGGVLSSALAPHADLPGKGWSLTSRQEIHPDEFEKIGELLCWLATRLTQRTRAGMAQSGSDPSGSMKPRLRMYCKSRAGRSTGRPEECHQGEPPK
ncbi:hypothetical protein AB0D45_31275 [Streptomyces sp. NPDC048352]|uniref:hypothetical protein n=1 Tax=Streptomyces sp. NPDC048352 TaxID=3154718 RepID=UPI0034207F25